MFKPLKKLLENEDFRRISENILSLFSLQSLNYILPLLTFPYLTRVLGPENYGLIAFAAAFIGFFQLLTDYGFNLSATREISVNRQDKEKVSTIFSSVMITKTLLTIISLFLILVIVFSFDKFRSEWLLYIFTFGLVIGNLLLPSWFFQGMEKMRYISILNIITALIFTISIFIFIRNPSDYIYVALINSIGSMISGTLGIWLVTRDFNMKFTTPSVEDIKYQLKEGWHVFISTVAISFFTTSNIFILGLFVNSTVVGYFAAGEKLVRAAQGVYYPISQSLYPYVSMLTTSSKTEAMEVIRKATWIMFILTSIVSLCLFFGAEILVQIFMGNQYTESVIVIKLLAFLPLIIGMATVYANLFLLAFKHTKIWTKIIIIAGVYSVSGAFILLGWLKLGLIGACLNIVITELVVLILSFYMYHKLKGL